MDEISFEHLFTIDHNNYGKEVFSYGENFQEYQKNVQDYCGIEKESVSNFEKNSPEDYITNPVYIKMKERLRLKLRRAAKANIFFLMTECLYPRNEYKPTEGLYGLLTRESKEMPNTYWCYDRCKEVEQERDGYGDFWSRGHLKSTIISVAMTIQEIIIDPSLCIGIMSEDGDLATNIVRKIRFGIMSLQWMFPEIIPDSFVKAKQVDRAQFFSVVSDNNTGTMTVSIISTKGKTGQHFDIIIYDDLMTNVMKGKTDLVKKAVDHIKSTFHYNSAKYEEEGTRVRFIGTYYDRNDVWHQLQEPDDPESECPYKVRIREGIVFKNEDEARRNWKDGGKLALFDRGQWHKNVVRKGLTKSDVFAQYLLRPEGSTEGEVLPPFTPILFPKGSKTSYDVTPYVFVDPAYTTNRDSDYTAIAVIGIGRDNTTRYILELIRIKISFLNLYVHLRDLSREYNPKCFFVEGNEDLHESVLKSAMDKEGEYFNIQTFSTKIRKADRVYAMGVQCARNNIVFCDNLQFDYVNETLKMNRKLTDGMEVFQKEYNKWTRASKNPQDDLLDAVAHSYVVDQDDFMYDPHHDSFRRKSHKTEDFFVQGTEYGADRRPRSIW